MLKKFAEGLVFGAGFAVSLLAVWWLGLSLFVPVSFGPPPDSARTESTTFSSTYEPEETPFHELPVEQQIEVATVIALVRYEPAADGKMRALISEILKKDPAVAFRYSVGDEYGELSYYPRPGTKYGDGGVVFFAGSPPAMRKSMSHSQGRIVGLGDMPLELLRQKAGTP
jgi:hypothetical protein